jgi:hypothetical protein
VHFAITKVQADALLEAADDDELTELMEEIEEAWDDDNLAESDKAWDAMHRCLTDGTLDYGAGEYPLNHCVLAPRQLHEDDDYIVCLVLPNEVRDVAAALRQITRAWFHQQYESILPNDYAPQYGPEDEEYTWSNFEDVRKLFEKAAERDRAVIFTVDQ